MNSSNIIKTTMIFLGLFLTTGCGDNPTGASTPESATITGTITFSGTWPSEGSVAVSLSSNWPPTGAPAAYAAITETDITNNTYTYTFENVTFGEYASIAISWSDPNDSNPATQQHTIGAYGGTCPFFAAYGGVDPTAITTSTTEYSLTGLDFTADFSFIPSPTCGI